MNGLFKVYRTAIHVNAKPRSVTCFVAETSPISRSIGMRHDLQECCTKARQTEIRVENINTLRGICFGGGLQEY